MKRHDNRPAADFISGKQGRGSVGKAGCSMSKSACGGCLAACAAHLACVERWLGKLQRRLRRCASTPRACHLRRGRCERPASTSAPRLSARMAILRRRTLRPGRCASHLRVCEPSHRCMPAEPARVQIEPLAVSAGPFPVRDPAILQRSRDLAQESPKNPLIFALAISIRPDSLCVLPAGNLKPNPA